MTKAKDKLSIAQRARHLKELGLTPDEFVVEVVDGPSSERPSARWAIRVALGPVSVMVRQRKRGKLQLDLGGRRGGGRRSAGTDDPREAVERAKRVLMHRRAAEILEVSTEALRRQDGLLVGDIRPLVTRTALPQTKTWDRYERSIRVAEALWGKTRPLATIDKVEMERGVARRAEGLPDHGLRPVKPSPALGQLKDFSTCVARVTEIRGEDYRKIFDANPLAGMEWPKSVRVKRHGKLVTEGVAREQRHPFSLELVEVLLSPSMRIEGREEVMGPAPVDAVDRTGVLRLVTVLQAFTGRRVESVLMLRLEDILRDRRSMSGLLETTPIDPAEVHLFPGLLNFRPEHDKEGYHYPIPIGEVVDREIGIYLAKRGHAPGWLFPAPKDPTKPIPYQTLYKSEWTCPETDRTKTSRFDRALRVVEEAVGEERAHQVVPWRKGDGPHRFRAFWATHMEALGYGYPDASGANLVQHVNFFGGWKVKGGDVRTQRYVTLKAHVLMGIANWLGADEVRAPKEKHASDRSKSLKDRLLCRGR